MRTLLLLLTLCLCYPMVAQYSSHPKTITTDTLPLTDHLHYHSFTKQSLKIGAISLPLMLSGVATYGLGREFRDLRNQFVPDFKYSYDDYLQYAPAIAMVGMKVAGVEGRSSWGRMLVSDAFSAILVAGAVNGIKYSVKELRPDNSAYNSFPSGHTTTAFMTATMLHKEYGETRSPLYSIAGYTLATATAISRQLNNRHWLADVLTGAGLGILATETGYLLADLIYKERGLKRPPLNFTIDQPDKPSFIGYYIGASSLFKTVSPTQDITLHTGLGTHVGVEGAYYFTPHWGIGMRLSAMSVPFSFDNDHYFTAHPELRSRVTNIATDPISTLTLGAGPYYHLPLWKRLSLEANLLVGYAYSLGNQSTITYNVEESSKTATLLSSTPLNALALSGGLALSCQVKSYLSVKLFAEYNRSNTNVNMQVNNLPDLTHTEYPQSVIGFNSLDFITYGISFNALLY